MSYTGEEGIIALEKAVSEAERIHGKIEDVIIFVTDNGITFKAKRFKKGIKDIGIELEIKIGHRMPKHIGRIERFHGTLKEECLWYEDLNNPYRAIKIIDDYCEYYNYKRPHWGIGLKTPIEEYTGKDYWEIKHLKLKGVKIA